MGFHLKIDRGQQKLLILKKSEVLGYYSLVFLQQKAIQKIGNGVILALTEAKKIGRREYFHLKEAYLLKDIDPVKFIDFSRYDIRLGVYRSGAKKGQPHDHGSAFRVKKSALQHVFKVHERIL